MENKKNNRFVALLRGINVGGNNIIKMTDLKLCFEEIGYTNVVTYIQSGNVVFDSNENEIQELSRRIENKLSERFNYQSKIVLITQQKLSEIIVEAPAGFGTKPDEYRYDVIFLREPLTATEALSVIKTKEGVDEVTPGNGVLYFSRLSSKSSQSKMNRMMGTAIYKEMTIRNWNTTTKLADL
jgi:uncharacterized protein (DUF1697 family)